MRRLAEFRHLTQARLETVNLTYIGIGGTGLQYVINNAELAHGYDIVILMTGGNDLDNGASETQLITDYSFAASLLMAEGVQQILITAIWPRQNAQFNSAARDLAEKLEARYYGHPIITFWLSERRQSFFTIDGVHLSSEGYQSASRYLASAIIWVLRHYGYFQFRRNIFL